MCKDLSVYLRQLGSETARVYGIVWELANHREIMGCLGNPMLSVPDAQVLVYES